MDEKCETCYYLGEAEYNPGRGAMEAKCYRYPKAQPVPPGYGCGEWKDGNKEKPHL